MPDGGKRLAARIESGQATIQPPANLVVACTLRSGSNLLCDVLRRNGFGDAKEWFQIEPDGGSMRHGDPEQRGLARQTDRFLAGHADASWRAVKFDWRQFVQFRAAAPSLPRAAPLLRDMLGGQWIFLRRRDLAAQAVSLYAAQVTGYWMAEESADCDRVPEDFDAIHERFAELAADEYSWDAFFRQAGITPARVHYEDLADPDGAASRDLLCRLDPGRDPLSLDLEPVEQPPRRHPRLRQLQSWFHGQLVSGRRPRSVLALLEEIGGVVARLERTPAAETVLGRFASDLIGNPTRFQLRKLSLADDARVQGPAALIAQDHFLDRVALRLDPEASCSFAVTARRVMVQFHAHAWSGVARIDLGGVEEDLDLYSERADTRPFVRDLPPGFSGVITIRSSGAKHVLSRGLEIWLQRVFVLAWGDQPDIMTQ